MKLKVWLLFLTSPNAASESSSPLGLNPARTSWLSQCKWGYLGFAGRRFSSSKVFRAGVSSDMNSITTAGLLLNANRNGSIVCLVSADSHHGHRITAFRSSTAATAPTAGANHQDC
jgi:hypothetical protein